MPKLSDLIHQAEKPAEMLNYRPKVAYSLTEQEISGTDFNQTRTGCLMRQQSSSFIMARLNSFLFFYFF